MVRTPVHTPSTTQKCPIEVQSTITMLEESMFIRRSELLAKVIVAAKDANGRISWFNLDPAYHSVLVNGRCCCRSKQPEALDCLHQGGPLYLFTQYSQRKTSKSFLYQAGARED